MTEYTWPEAARNDKAFGEKIVLGKIEEERLRRTENTLAHLIGLNECGLDNWWVRSNIKFYATRYHQITNEWYHHTPSLQKTSTGGSQ